MSYEMRRFAGTELLVGAVICEWLEFLRQHSTDGGRSLVAFGGGRVFSDFLQVAAVEIRAQTADLTRVEFFWGDERCVPPDHPESNYRLALESFFKPLGIGLSQIHRLRGEVDPAEAARAAEAVLRVTAGAGATGQPVLDLLFLGMGEDGHVASLFPAATPEVTESTAVYLPVVGPKPPVRRLTLTYPAIAAARHVWVIASGRGKEAALEASLRPNGTTPLARVLRDRSSTILFTDIGS